MRPLLRAILLLVMALLAAQAVAGTAFGETGASVAQTWCGAGGDVSVHPYVFPYGLQARLDASARLGGAAMCVHVAFEGADAGLGLPA